MEINEPITIRVVARNFRGAIDTLKDANASFDPVSKTWTIDPDMLPKARRKAGGPLVPLTEFTDRIAQGIEDGRYEIVE